MAANGFVPWSGAEMSAVEPADIAYQLLPDSDYLDSGSFLVFLADGSILFIQVVISSVGMFSHEPGITVKHIVDTETQTQMAIKFSKKDIVLEDGGCSLRLKDNAFLYDAAANTFRVVIPAQSGNAVGAIDVVFAADSPSFKVSGGRVVLGEGKFIQNVFPMPRALVSGTVRLLPASGKGDGVETQVAARGFVSRLLQNVKATRVATQWSLAKFDSDRLSVMLVGFKTPAEFERQWVYLVSVVLDGKLVLVTTAAEIELGPLVKDAKTGYSVPESTRLVARGDGPGGVGPVELVLPMVHRAMWDRYDILAAVPWLIRTVIKTFVAAPWCYRYVDPATAVVTVAGAAPVEATGQVLREFVFVVTEK